MPELPEVETVRRGLAPVLEGATIALVEQRRPDLRFPLPERLAARLEGQRITSLERRAKYLVARLSGGEALVMHLGMTGRFTILAPSARSSRPSGGVPQTGRDRRKRGAALVAGPHPDPLPIERESGDGKVQLAAFVHATSAASKHDHVVLHLASGAAVTYNDARRFGFMLLVPQAGLAAHALFRNLGPEPLGADLDAAYLAARAAGRRADLKAFLMDQRTVAGLGNIYVCEALHRAGLSPQREAAVLARAGGRPGPGTGRLVGAIREVLQAAISAGGSTLRDYRAADGGLGYFQHQFAVYGREGEPCARPGCGGIVRRIVQGGRSTFYCPRCQR